MHDSRKPSSPNTAPTGRGLRRVTRARPIGDLIGRTLDKACRRRGFVTSDLLQDWPDIVGVRYSGRVQPVRLDWPRLPNGARDSGLDEDRSLPATLVVQTDGATALLLSHDMPQVIARINGFFGWAAVARIRIIQRPVSRRQSRRPPDLRALTKEEEASLTTQLSGVTDQRLAAALMKLGHAVKAKRRKA